MVRVAGFMQRTLDEQIAGFVAGRRAADRVAALDDQHLAPGAREDRAGRQASKAGADHHYVIARHQTENPAWESCWPDMARSLPLWRGMSNARMHGKGAFRCRLQIDKNWAISRSIYRHPSAGP
jgi:hypothetical protein